MRIPNSFSIESLIQYPYLKFIEGLPEFLEAMKKVFVFLHIIILTYFLVCLRPFVVLILFEHVTSFANECTTKCLAP